MQLTLEPQAAKLDEGERELAGRLASRKACLGEGEEAAGGAEATFQVAPVVHRAAVRASIQLKKGRLIQVLAGLAPPSQTVESLFRVIHEQAE
jgi:hypothetical protein